MRIVLRPEEGYPEGPPDSESRMGRRLGHSQPAIPLGARPGMEEDSANQQMSSSREGSRVQEPIIQVSS